LSETLGNNSTRQTELNKEIGSLKARGNTGLYATIDAGLKDVVANYKTDATNMVVLMTDGKDDPDPGSTSPIDLTQLEVDITKNHSTKQAVPIVTIGLGPDADYKKLQEISRTSGAVSLTSVSGFDIDQVLLSALFGVSSDG
jgi:Ca-activated chloride channel family protein